MAEFQTLFLSSDIKESFWHSWTIKMAIKEELIQKYSDPVLSGKKDAVFTAVEKTK